jgi:hypothetical protein
MTMRREEAEACLAALRSRPWPPSKSELEMLRRVSDLGTPPAPSNVRQLREARVVALPVPRVPAESDFDPLPAA